MNLAAIGIAGTWISILASHMVFVLKARKGETTRPSFQLHGAPVANVVTILVLLCTIIAMWFEPEVGRPTIFLFLGVCVLMVIGWFAVRNRIRGDLLDEFLDDELDDANDSADHGER